MARVHPGYVGALVVCLAVAACGKGPELERLPPPASAPSLLPAERPPPPPPPPPPARVERTLPPPAIAKVLGDSPDPERAWRVTLYDLGRRADRGPRFMGLAIRATRVLDAETSQRVVRRLREKIYRDSDVGGFTEESLGVRVADGDAALELVYNDGHLFLTPELHDGPFVVIDGTWLEGLLDRAR